MKVIASVVAAVLAGSAAATEGGEAAASGQARKGGLTIEHLAFAYAGFRYLDGPAKQAGCPLQRPGAGLWDNDGNVWFGQGGNAWSMIGGRCLVAESGLIRPCFGNDYWSSEFPADEGPGSAMYTVYTGAGLGQPVHSQFVWGSPFLGEEKGFLLFSNGEVVRKVFRNAGKENRWWFMRIIGGGKTPLPTVKGGEVGARDASGRIDMVQVLPGGRIVVFARGGFYELKGDKLLCLLGCDDYKGSGVLAKDRLGNPDLPTMGILGGDGTFYMGTYFRTGYGYGTPSVYRLVPGKGLEAYAWAVKGKHLDGPAMASGAMCGHHIWARQHNYEYIAADCLYLTAHDELTIRRVRDGRVSTVCRDGEWRELADRPDIGWWAHSWAPGPGGRVSAFGHFNSEAVTSVITGIDWNKATVGPPIEASVPPWPPKNVDVSKEGKR